MILPERNALIEPYKKLAEVLPPWPELRCKDSKFFYLTEEKIPIFIVI